MKETKEREYRNIFGDSIRSQYGFQIASLPTTCACG